MGSHLEIQHDYHYQNNCAKEKILTPPPKYCCSHKIHTSVWLRMSFVRTLTNDTCGHFKIQ